MIQLQAHEHERLQQLARAKADGVPLRDIGLSTALRLQLAGFATIQISTPQTVWVTDTGAAHVRRGVFA